jgi:hybrid cluster-associated redox disulfide protein
MQLPSLDGPDLTLSDLMETWPETISVFLHYRILCVGCIISRFHTVTDACCEHNIDETEFRAALAAAARLRA